MVVKPVNLGVQHYKITKRQISWLRTKNIKMADGGQEVRGGARKEKVLEKMKGATTRIFQ